MRQHERKAAAEARERVRAGTPFAVIPLHDTGRSSERRFDQLTDQVAVQTVRAATRAFADRHALRIGLVLQADEVPDLAESTYFKYSGPHGSGSLAECADRQRDGEPMVIALVWQDDVLIGYGIASVEDGSWTIEIVDVDLYSRRSSGLADPVQVAGQSFHVGVGHVVVDALMQRCSRPIRVDATHSTSRFVFKSLGFVPMKPDGNPCLLELPKG